MPPPGSGRHPQSTPCAAFRERLPASKQSPSLRLSPQPAPFDKGAKPTRGCLRRRNFPVCRRGFSCSVGRAFTPAAPRQFQNWNVPAAAGCGGMGHPALRSFYMLRAHRQNRCAPAVGRRGGIYPSRGRSRRRKVCGRGVPLPYMPSGNDRPPGVFAPPWGAAGWGIPPYGRFICSAHTGKTAARRTFAGLPPPCAFSPRPGCGNRIIELRVKSLELRYGTRPGGRDQNTAATFPPYFLSRPQGGDPPNLNS